MTKPGMRPTETEQEFLERINEEARTMPILKGDYGVQPMTKEEFFEMVEERNMERAMRNPQAPQKDNTPEIPALANELLEKLDRAEHALHGLVEKTSPVANFSMSFPETAEPDTGKAPDTEIGSYLQKAISTAERIFDQASQHRERIQL